MLKLAPIFNHGMIVQRNSCVRIWGTSDKESVKVFFIKEAFCTKVVDGKWYVDIDTLDTREEEIMTITEYEKGQPTDSIIINDILFGEVWLAGGQSNMELELQNSENGEEVVRHSDYDKIRFFNVPKCSFIDDDYYSSWEKTAWKKAKGEQCADVSAVGYYFAKKLYEELNVPIGIIDCYWGGTSATCWVSEKHVGNIDEVKDYIDGWNECCTSKSDEQYAIEMKAYEEEYNNWVSTVEELRAKNPLISWISINETAGPCPWPQPRGKKSPFRPFGLHETMVSKIAPYSLKGFIYYQAEEDWDKAAYYHKLNTAVINQFREDFSTEKDDSVKPFYITQLPMYQENGKSDDKVWCKLRQEQEKCAETVDGTYLVSIIDLGEFDNIHPINKEIPGTRLGERALTKTYHTIDDLEYMKCYKAEFYKDKCVLTLSNMYDGISFKDNGDKLTGEVSELMLLTEDNCDQVKGLEISSNGIDFFSPIIRIEDRKLLLSTNDNSEVRAVRYAWFNFGVANLYNSKKYPLLPFEILSDN